MYVWKLTLLAGAALTIPIALAPLQSGAQTNEIMECGTPASGMDTWEVAKQASAGWDIKGLCALAEHLDASPQENVHGVVVVHANRLVFEKYITGPDERWGLPLGDTAHGPNVLHDVRSVTKSVISLLVGIAIDRKLIGGVDQPVLGFFPEYAPLRSPEKDGILLRHLLAMSSGLAWDENRPYSDPKNSEIRMARARGSLPIRARAASVEPTRHSLELQRRLDAAVGWGRGEGDWKADRGLRTRSAIRAIGHN